MEGNGKKEKEWKELKGMQRTRMERNGKGKEDETN